MAGLDVCRTNTYYLVLGDPMSEGLDGEMGVQQDFGHRWLEQSIGRALKKLCSLRSKDYGPEKNQNINLRDQDLSMLHIMAWSDSTIEAIISRCSGYTELDCEGLISSDHRTLDSMSRIHE
jgi:hypothetical protein